MTAPGRCTASIAGRGPTAPAGWRTAGRYAAPRSSLGRKRTSPTPLGNDAALPSDRFADRRRLLAGCDLVGLGTSSSRGSQSSTAQMTSRSSSRILTGLPDHRYDIFPALITKPRSASMRCSSLAFQMPRLAAASRRFQIIGHSLQAGSRRAELPWPRRPRCGCGARVLAHGGRDPLMAEQFLDGDDVHPVLVQARDTVVAQHMRGEPVPQPGRWQPTASASPSRSASSPMRVLLWSVL